ncbi:class I SAM-dependent methyltransferase [Acholeplasma equirhinis]|uniref:class I SAM-dependent methyltransferase n=1 Tax=Acholeplasma equirhinis TaxID=555393 RepID=UPI00197AC6F0|nr:class I SAM-dependent methyltransferase [Acholeplasma equirhinis]MBN3490584.1 class I SAM-dependent methyltransferase [Acholeplasma equirhinis]
MTFEQVYDILQQDVNYPKLLKPILKYLDKSKTTLDAGCGSGYILKYLVSQGYPMVGLDINKDMLKLAQEKLEKENLSCELIKHDIRKKIPRKFDQIISLLDVSHYFMGVKKVFHNYYQALNPNGILILDLYRLPIFEEEEGIYQGLSYHWEVYTTKAQIVHELEVSKDGLTQKFKVKQWYNEIEYYEAILLSLGFKVKIIKSFDDRKVFLICKK